MEFVYQNVNQAFSGLVRVFNDKHSGWVETDSRNGPVRTFEDPVRVTYLKPQQKVLFNPARDANPFFHLFESLWMLAGRNDVAPLKYYVSTIGDYSDDGKTLHGAYGHRWRIGYDPRLNLECKRDQLTEIAKQLKEDPGSRRCVLQMWDVDEDLEYETKDKPCNLSVCFKIREVKIQGIPGGPGGILLKVLDMTVFNRSNDLIWGMLGANVVHFSILQEYMAARIGVGVGKYHQITNNLHIYTNKWEPEKWFEGENLLYSELYKNIKHPRLVVDPNRFDSECKQITDSIDGTFEEPFLHSTAQPMFAAFRKHKQRKYIGDQGALELIERVHATDWRVAGREWLQRRKERWENK